MDAETIVDTTAALDTLSELPRTGWLLRGIRPCESIADHSFGVVLVTAMLIDALREQGLKVDGERAMKLAVLHDAPEARTGDIPMPSKTAEVADAMDSLERRIASELLPDSWLHLYAELEAGSSLEARAVSAADKLQMMIKVMVYERQGRGCLEEFWANPNNFRHRDLDIAKDVFRLVCERAGHPCPVPL